MSGDTGEKVPSQFLVPGQLISPEWIGGFLLVSAEPSSPGLNKLNHSRVDIFLGIGKL